MNNRTYVIINESDLTSVTFSQVLETSANTVRKNNDETLIVLKYEGDEPESLLGIDKVEINGRFYHNHSEILEIMGTTGSSGWIKNEEDI